MWGRDCFASSWNSSCLSITPRYRLVRLDRAKARWHVTQDIVTRPDCPPPPPPVYVCLCVFLKEGGASDHTAQPWELSNTAGTSPPPPPPLAVSYPLLLLPLPLFPLLAPQTSAGSFDTGALSSVGEHFHLYLLGRLWDPPPPFLMPNCLSSAWKKLPCLLCVCFRRSVIDIDMIWEGRERKSLRPIRDDLSLFCCFWGASSAKKTTRLVFSTGCQEKRESVPWNKCHATYI